MEIPITNLKKGQNAIITKLADGQHFQSKIRTMGIRGGKSISVVATRAPWRPNPIGLSVVRLIGIRDNIPDIDVVDIVNATLLLDIKPYVSDFDICNNVKSGWYEHAGNR